VQIKQMRKKILKSWYHQAGHGAVPLQSQH
jgi:hypothetical protein